MAINCLPRIILVCVHMYKNSMHIKKTKLFCFFFRELIIDTCRHKYIQPILSIFKSKICKRVFHDLNCKKLFLQVFICA